VKLYFLDMTNHNIQKEFSVDAIRPNQKILTPGKKYRVEIVGGLTPDRIKGRRVSIADDVAGCVCVCLSQSRDKITMFRNAVASLRASALLVFHRPIDDTDFPVFVAAADAFTDIEYSSSVHATFELHNPPSCDDEVSSYTLSKTEDYLPFCSNAPLKSSSVQSSVMKNSDERHINDTQELPTSIQSYADAVRSQAKNDNSKPSNVVTTTSVSSRDVRRNGASGNLFGLGQIFETVGTAVRDGANTIKKNIFGDNEKFFKKNFKGEQNTNENCYGHALEKMQYFDGSQQIEAVKGLVKSTLNETSFGHAVAAALICNNSNDHDLDCDVLKYISKLTTLNDDLDFLKKTKPKKCLKDFVLPQNVLYTFLVRTVTIWGQVNPSSFDDGKWKCLVLLDVCGLTKSI
jgi:hypothetical protein